jgi:hypothetical protein
MSLFSGTVQGRLQHAFAENQMALSVRPDHIIVEDSQAGSKEKVQKIVEAAGFCPLISQNKINNNFVFSVSPYIIPDFFNQSNLDNHQGVPCSLSSLRTGFGSYFTINQVRELLNPHHFVFDKQEKVKDKWFPVNIYRSIVTPALSKGLCELVSKYARADHPIVEIGSGIGYSTEELSNVIITQPNEDECKLLKEATSAPIYKLDVQGIHKCLSESGKKIPLFFALNVFDTLTPESRKTSFLQLSQLQNSGDRILVMLDTNPCFGETVEHIGSLYPDHNVLPYFPITNDPAKFSVILVPQKFVRYKLTSNEVLELLDQESQSVMSGKVSQYQSDINKLKVNLGLNVIILEEFYAEQVKNELAEVGYEADVHYHNSFACADISNKYSEINKDLAYKPVSDTFTVRQWSLTDEKLLKSLSKKGLALPREFTAEFIDSLKQKHQVVLGAECLVIDARKV